MNSRVRTVSRRSILLGSAAVVLSGCGSVHYDPQDEPASPEVGSTPPIIATLNNDAISGPVSSLSFAAAGRYLAASDGTTVSVWRTDGITSSTPAVYSNSNTGPVAFVPNGDQLFVASGGGQQAGLAMWAPGGGALTSCSTCVASPRTPPTGGVSCRGLAISPSGKLGAMADNTGLLWIWEVESRRVVKVLSEDADYPTVIAFDPSESKIVTAGYSVASWDVATGERQEFPSLKTSTMQSLAFSPSGETILFGGSGLAAVEATTGKTLHGPTDLSGGGNVGIYAQGGARVVDVDALSNISIRPADLSDPIHEWMAAWPTTSVAYSPQRNLLAVGASQGIVYIWDCKGFL